MRTKQKCATGVHAGKTLSESERGIGKDIKRLGPVHIWCEEGGLNLGEKVLRAEQKPDNSNPETEQILAECGSEQVAPSRSKNSLAALVNTFLTGKNTLLRKKCATGVHDNSLELISELEFIISVWADLDDKVQKQILKMISKHVLK